jgi:hypothetical protein
LGAFVRTTFKKVPSVAVANENTCRNENIMPTMMTATISFLKKFKKTFWKKPLNTISSNRATNINKYIK